MNFKGIINEYFDSCIYYLVTMHLFIILVYINEFLFLINIFNMLMNETFNRKWVLNAHSFHFGKQ